MSSARAVWKAAGATSSVAKAPTITNPRIVLPHAVADDSSRPGTSVTRTAARLVPLNRCEFSGEVEPMPTQRGGPGLPSRRARQVLAKRDRLAAIVLAQLALVLTDLAAVPADLRLLL